jgi:hypothetical protein
MVREELVGRTVARARRDFPEAVAVFLGES